MTPHLISIDRLLAASNVKGLNFNNRVLLYNKVDELSMFKHPCRLDAIVVMIVVRGTLECKINLQSCTLSHPCVLVNLPMNILSIERADHIEAFTLIISNDYLEELQLEMSQRVQSYLQLRTTPYFVTDHQTLHGLRGYYALMEQAMSDPVPETSGIVGGLVRSFLFQVIAIYNRLRPSHSSSGATSHNEHVFNRFMLLVAEHHTTERKVEFYASRLFLSPKHMSSIIRQCSGKTASEWINDYVILEIKSLLRFSGMGIQEISNSMNFPTQSAFGKYFKSRTGMSPKKYMDSVRHQEM